MRQPVSPRMSKTTVDITISLDGFVAAPGDDVTRLGPQPIEFERGRVIDSPAVTHLRYRVLR